MAGALMKTGGQIAPLVPESFEDVQRMARMIRESGFAPKDSNETQVAGAIMKGLEIGVPPMQAVQGIAVINGRPAIWGDLMIALVQRHDLCEGIEEWVDGEGDAMVAHCEARRRGRANPIKRSFSAADAKKARLWQTKERIQKRKKDGGFYEADNDSPWYRFPKRMLQMRARALCLRDAFPDVLSGLASAEEARDDEREMRDVTPEEPANPLVDPPREAVFSREAEDVSEEGAPEAEDGGEGDPSAEDGNGDGEALTGDGEASDATVSVFQLAGVDLFPPEETFSTSDLLSFLTRMIAAQSLEGVMGVEGDFKGIIELLPEGERAFYRVVSGYKRAIIKGTSTDPEGHGLTALKGWIMADYGRASE